MKKVLFLFSFLLLAGMMTGQTAEKAAKKSCAKTCAKTCTKGAAKTVSTDAINIDAGQVASIVAEADALAASDESVERKECATSGKVSYFQKSVCPTSGKVSSSEVKFCETSKKFVNVAPSTLEADANARVIQVSDKAAKGAAKSASKKECTKGAKAATTNKKM